MAKDAKADMPFWAFSREADVDYLLARSLHFTGIAFQGRAGFFAHGACEKYMKAITVQGGEGYIETHKLLELAKECEKYADHFAEPETVSLLNDLDAFDQVGRYGMAANFDPHAQTNDQFQTAGVMVWRSAYLRGLDKFVYQTRALFDFKNGEGHDLLKSILSNNRQSMMVKEWKGRRPLIVVLTKENQYYKKPSKKR